MLNRTITKHYFISGRVQGVGFRAFTRRMARHKGLGGWVRNLEDGRVEAMVRGDEAAVSDFEKELRQGPPHGKVERLEAGDGVTEALPLEFEIR